MSEEYTKNPGEYQKNVPSHEEEAAKMLAEREAASSIEYDLVEDVKKDIEPEIKSLGKAQSFRDDGEHVGPEIGWKPMPVDNLPSGGRFYPEGTTLEIRPAMVGEIRHFSTLDENDPLDMDDKLNMIVDKCVRMKFPERHANWKDLKEEDRFYLIFAIRDFTFVKGENKLTLTLKCGRDCAGDGTYEEKVEINKDNFDYYKIDQKIDQFYNEEQRCFVIDSPKVGTIKLYVPSLGVTTFIKNYMRKKIRDNRPYDKAFLRIAPFLFDDWRGMTEKSYDSMVSDSLSWSPLKLSAIMRAAELIRFGVKTEVTRECNQCGVEVRTPLNFPGGVKSLFLPSDPLDELF